MGHSIKRKEDPRFVRGQGTYVDDIRLPGMIYLDIVRSPFAHATIKKINPSKALSIPGVLAVITGQDLAKYNLHWMPTLMSDTQMVLPVDKVMFQSQEVAAVLATDRYIAADGVEAVEVEYDPLPVVVDPKKALEPGAPILRTDKKDKKDNHIFHWEVGDKSATEKDGTLTALRIKTIADHGYTDAAANPSKFPAELFAICTGSYNLRAAHVQVDGAYTNKPPGGIAYRCSFRVTEAAYAIERMVDIMAHELNMDPADFRRKNFIPADSFPYKSALGWEYDSGNYDAALTKAMEKIGYAGLRKEQAEKRTRGELMGIGISSFTEIVGAGPSKHFDILGLKMFDSCEIRVHPTGKAIARFGTKSQGQGHETTYAQIVAEELGIPAKDIQIEEGDTDTAPYGLGTYASRSTPVAGAAAAVAARKVRDKARKIAAHLMEVAEQDLEWEPGKFSVKGAPGKSKTIQECAFAAYTNHPQGMEAGLEAVSYYDPPNLTYPFGSYICVVDIDSGTGEVKVRRFVAIDDCGNIINPMIVQGQIHGGLTMGLAPALYEEISYDDNGNIQGGSFIDYLLPTAVETPKWETGHTVTPSPHHPLGAKGVGESATVGAPAAIANAVVDALWHLGVRHIDIPITPAKVWKVLREKGVTE